MLSMYRNVPQPPAFIVHSPEQFYQWVEWASEYKSEATGKIEPFGKEFDYFEDTIDSFISYYDSLRPAKS